MNIESFRMYCLTKKGVTECFPFDNSTLVFKVMDKMFALTGLYQEEFTANLKCDPQYAEELRAAYTDINPGYHMSKKHWNTVKLESMAYDDVLLKKLIDHSYELVSDKLPKKLKEALAAL